jgi:hypothetical protein
MTAKLQARARVRVSLIIQLDRPWPEDESVKNVHLVCEREAAELTQNILAILRGNPTSRRPGIVSADEPEIVGIWLEPAKG